MFVSKTFIHAKVGKGSFSSTKFPFDYVSTAGATQKKAKKTGGFKRIWM